MNQHFQLTLITLALSIAAMRAQTYGFDWSTIDGGGGTSSGAVYVMSGTIGQPDAGVMSGGGFTVNGGFWAGVAPGLRPALSIRHGTPNTVTLSWPDPSTGYVLQQTANMNAPGGGWTEVTQMLVINGGNKEVTLPATGRFCLFRLRHP